MPVQPASGRRLSLRSCNRRYQVLFVGFACFLLAFVFFRESVNEIDFLPDGIPRPSMPSLPSMPNLPNIPNLPALPNLPSLPTLPKPFGPPVHTAPTQENSTNGDSSWFSDFRWKNPFSSTITLDENRALLPQLKNRPDVYTFYEPSDPKNKTISAAEEKLLLTWRRAWWAQGFKPKVLGRQEAKKNELYLRMQPLNITKELETDLARLLAWGSITSGILTNWLTLPMGPYDDSVLTFLRRGQYPKFARFEGLEDGIFYGEKRAVNNVIKNILENPDIENPEFKSIIHILDEKTLSIDKKPKSIVFYNLQTIHDKYTEVSEALFKDDRAAGLVQLAQLINSHLHITWQNAFPKGVAVLKPFNERMDVLTSPAISLAQNLTHCSDSPLPASCPPNNPKCKPCDPEQPLPIDVTPNYPNDSSVFTIGIVPHPYTTTTLVHNQQLITSRFIRDLGMGERDAWLHSIAKDITGPSGGEPLVRFKELVTSDRGAARATWLTAERETHADLDWLFGFAIPGSPPRDVDRAAEPEDDLLIPGNEEGASLAGVKAALDELALRHEQSLLYQAREVMRSVKPEVVRLREAVEAWNLGDTEVWRFARAWSARRRVERLKWEEEERLFAGAEERGGRWGWFGR